MAQWHEIEAEALEFASRVRALFQPHKHKPIAALRADGSPRISGIETRIGEQLSFGSMTESRKLADLLRDPPAGVAQPVGRPACS